MKFTKKAKITLGAIICSGLLGLSSANAAVCENATITQAGVYPYLPDTVSYTINATCGDQTPAWSGEMMFFVANDAYAESLYAAALTAVSTGNISYVLVSSPVQYGTVKMLNVTSTP